VLSENVPGIGDPRYGGIWENFRHALERLGYATGSRVVCTSRYQNRAIEAAQVIEELIALAKDMRADQRRSLPSLRPCRRG
jgi:hypothetical protein